jgi:FkbM family methyltransferase
VLRLTPDLPLTISVGDLGAFRIRARTNRSYWLRDPLANEFEPMSLLAALAKPAGTALDVGANIGLYSRYLVRTLGFAHVYAFEPFPLNWRRFEENVRLGGITSRVTLLPIALGDVNGSASFQIDDFQTTSGALDAASPGKPSLGRANLGLPSKTCSVVCRTLDSLLADGTLPAVDVVKSDIEGAEHLLLAGAERTLRQDRPSWMIELHGPQVARSVSETLLRNGYRCRGFGNAFGSSRYGEVNRSLLNRVEDLYDLHYLAAADDEAVFARLDQGQGPSSALGSMTLRQGGRA